MRWRWRPLDGRRIASYATYFEVAWKLAVQLLFSASSWALWAVLWMGAAVHAGQAGLLAHTLTKDWFNVPVICTAWSCAMHVTDVRPAIVRGIRTCCWCCVVDSAGGGADGYGLPVHAAVHRADRLVGDAPRHFGAADGECGALVLINAAFQNGEAKVVLALRVSAHGGAAVAAGDMVAVYALGLRVHDYGWTSDRVWLRPVCWWRLLCIGYQWAAISTTPGSARHQVNVWTAFVVLAVLLALFTPLADPARIGQPARWRVWPGPPRPRISISAICALKGSAMAARRRWNAWPRRQCKRRLPS
jgi:hypothetical protein